MLLFYLLAINHINGHEEGNENGNDGEYSTLFMETIQEGLNCLIMHLSKQFLILKAAFECLQNETSQISIYLNLANRPELSL